MSSVSVETKVDSRVDGFQGIAKVAYEGEVEAGRTVESPIFSTKEGAQDWCTALQAGEVVNCQFDEHDPKAQDTFQLEAYKTGVDSSAPEPEEQGSEEQESPSGPEQKSE
jgi:hypothetical protein